MFSAAVISGPCTNVCRQTAAMFCAQSRGSAQRPRNALQNVRSAPPMLHGAPRGAPAPRDGACGMLTMVVGSGWW